MKCDYTVTHMAWEGDGVTGLYNGDVLVFYGDEYHDDIGASIDSFIEGVKSTGRETTRKDIYVSADVLGDDWDYHCPDTLTELKEKWTWAEDIE